MIPPTVRRAANQLLAEHPERRELLQRLLADPRMIRVWRELLRRHRTGDRAFLHPAVGSEQSAALALLFHQVFFCAALGLRTVSQGERRRAQRPYLQRAQQLRDDAADLDPELAESLDAAAAVYDQLAGDAAPPLDDPLVIERQRSNSQLRGFVIALSLTLKDLFGTDLSGLVATLANVALDRSDVTRDRVRVFRGCKTRS